MFKILYKSVESGQITKFHKKEISNKEISTIVKSMPLTDRMDNLKNEEFKSLLKNFKELHNSNNKVVNKNFIKEKVLQEVIHFNKNKIFSKVYPLTLNKY